jgi:hypothetical protein
MNLTSILSGSADPQRLVDSYTKLFGVLATRAEPGHSRGAIHPGTLSIVPGQ